MGVDGFWNGIFFIFFPPFGDRSYDFCRYERTNYISQERKYVRKYDLCSLLIYYRQRCGMGASGGWGS
jgi:hypothetical protein